LKKKTHHQSETQRRLELAKSQLVDLTRDYSKGTSRELSALAKKIADGIPRVDDPSACQPVVRALAQFLSVMTHRGEPSLALEIDRLFENLPPSTFLYTARLEALIALRFGSPPDAAVVDPQLDEAFTAGLIHLLK
jgi:hypothetical protein